jgi:hypothetical protein
VSCGCPRHPSTVCLPPTIGMALLSIAMCVSTSMCVGCRTAMKELRAEFSGKLEAVAAQVAQLQRAVNVSKGEANILAQQNKDTARRVTEVAEQVRRLALEVVGEDDEGPDEAV